VIDTPDVAPGESFVTPEATVQYQLEQVIKAGSPLQELAESRSAEEAQQMGLLSTSMAVGAGQKALYDTALDVARPDAETYARAGLTEQQATNILAQTGYEGDIAAALKTAEGQIQFADTAQRGQIEKELQYDAARQALVLQGVVDEATMERLTAELGSAEAINAANILRDINVSNAELNFANWEVLQQVDSKARSEMITSLSSISENFNASLSQLQQADIGYTAKTEMIAVLTAGYKDQVQMLADIYGQDVTWEGGDPNTDSTEPPPMPGVAPATGYEWVFDAYTNDWKQEPIQGYQDPSTDPTDPPPDPGTVTDPNQPPPPDPIVDTPDVPGSPVGNFPGYVYDENMGITTQEQWDLNPLSDNYVQPSIGDVNPNNPNEVWDGNAYVVPDPTAEYTVGMDNPDNPNQVWDGDAFVDKYTVGQDNPDDPMQAWDGSAWVDRYSQGDINPADQNQIYDASSRTFVSRWTAGQDNPSDPNQVWNGTTWVDKYAVGQLNPDNNYQTWDGNQWQDFTPTVGTVIDPTDPNLPPAPDGQQYYEVAGSAIVTDNMGTDLISVVSNTLDLYKTLYPNEAQYFTVESGGERLVYNSPLDASGNIVEANLPPAPDGYMWNSRAGSSSDPTRSKWRLVYDTGNYDGIDVMNDGTLAADWAPVI
jgi:hypothetical protein